MRVNKNSWHYRFMYYLDSNVPNSLCAYVRKLIASLLLVPIMLCAVMFVAFLVTAPIINLFYTVPWTPVIIGGVLNVVVLTGILIDKVKGRRTHNPPPPTLVGAWYRAKKDKICPTLEFYEE